MDRDTEKRLDRLEAKLDKLIKLVEASADPRLVASVQGEEILSQMTQKQDSKAPPTGKGAGGKVGSREM